MALNRASRLASCAWGLARRKTQDDAARKEGNLP